eukprot:1781489-Amphidinium_carterae.1
MQQKGERAFLWRACRGRAVRQKLSSGAHAEERHTTQTHTESSGAHAEDTATQHLRIYCGAWLCLSSLESN